MAETTPAERDAAFAVIAHCPAREDETHCEHWLDGEPCCSCGSDEGQVDGDNGPWTGGA